MHLGRRLVVAVAAPGEAGAGVVAVIGVAEGELHEAREGDAPAGGDLTPDHRGEGRRTLREGEVVGRLRAHGVIVAVVKRAPRVYFLLSVEARNAGRMESSS